MTFQNLDILFDSLSNIKFLKYWLAKTYKSVHPIVKPKTEIIVPYNLPNKNPATKAIGVAKPKSNIQIIENKKNRVENNNRFWSLTAIKNWVLSLI